MFNFYLKQAIRVLQKRRGFAVAVIATFAVAIGVNATSFALRDAILGRTVEVADADNLIGVFGTSKGEAANGSFARSDYLYYKENLKGVSDLAGHYSTSPMTFSAADIAPHPIVG